ncbi:MAG: thioredoxin domain-containing protein [Deltaproteobacteria bacterium]|nr:thioredoxin domain-containing protein [Deltaproteobacteria bacterium]
MVRPALIRAHAAALSLVASALLGPAAHADGQCAHGSTVLRVFLDLQCPHCQRAWPDTVRAASEAPCVRVAIQQLPNSAHAHAAWSAQVALAAREIGRELAFVDALYATGGADRPAVERALVAVGLDTATLLARAAVLGSTLEAEKQSALAFGVRATPSVLVNGKGVAGGLAYQTMRDTLAVAAHQSAALAAEFGLAVDVERARMLLEAPEFIPAYDAMRSAHDRGQVKSTGALGARWRVGVRAIDVVAGAQDAPATLVAFASPAVPWTVAQIAALLPLAGPETRLAVHWLAEPSSGQAGAAMAGSLLAVATQAPDRLPRLVLLWDRAPPPGPAEVANALAGAPPQLASALQATAASGETAVRLSTSLDQARHVEAVPGAIFVNGRRWLGTARDAGLGEAVQAAAREGRDRLASQPLQSRVYDVIVAQGQWRTEVDLQFGPAQPIGDAAAIPAIGSSGPDVVLLGEIGQPATRAAWFMLRRLTRPGPRAIRLRLAPSGSGASAVRLREAYIAAAVAGRADVAAEQLFAAANPADRAVLAKVGGNTHGDGRAAAALDAIARLRRCCAWGDEPVIAVRGRAYLGPLDEARLGEAIAALAAAR